MYFIREVDTDDKRTDSQQNQGLVSQASVPTSASTATSTPSADQNVVTASTSSGHQVTSHDVGVSTDNTSSVITGVKRKYKKPVKHEYQTYRDRYIHFFNALYFLLV